MRQWTTRGEGQGGRAGLMGRGAAKDGREARAEGPETTGVQLWWTHCDTDERRLVEWTVLSGRACWAGGTRVRGGGCVGRTLLAEAGLWVWASKPGRSS